MTPIFTKVALVLEDIESEPSIAKDLGYYGQLAKCSPFHLHRIFKTLTGHSLLAYQRSRVLFYAAGDLRLTQRNILDIALDYGYQSHEAFSRAFSRNFGISPSVWRDTPKAPLTVPKIDLWGKRAALCQKGLSIRPRIHPQPGLLLAGFYSQISLKEEENYPLVSKISQRLSSLRESIPFTAHGGDYPMDRQFGIIPGASYDPHNPYSKSMPYFRGYEVTQKGILPEDLQYLEIPSFIAASIKTSTVPQEHSLAIDALIGQWLPEAPYDLDHQTLNYMEIISTTPEWGEAQIFLPVVEQQELSNTKQ